MKSAKGNKEIATYSGIIYYRRYCSFTDNFEYLFLMHKEKTCYLKNGYPNG